MEDFSVSQPAPQETFYFFSLRSFNKDVGETLRIYGIVNALAAAGHEVILVSNATRYTPFHPAVVQVPIGFAFKQKRLLQAFAAVLPAVLVKRLFARLFKAITSAIANTNGKGAPWFFFDYLDNTIGYLLAQSGELAAYVNDIHGIATTEFLWTTNNAKSMTSKVWYRFKYKAAATLDKKVFEGAAGFFFGSADMESYFEREYTLKNKKRLVLPYLLDSHSLQQPLDATQIAIAKEAIGAKEVNFTFLFVGTYKATAGVEDLIWAFNKLYREAPNCRLVLVGEGPQRSACEALASSLLAGEAITFLEPVPYAILPAYYSLVQVVVCPDRDNEFSQYVVHIKYLDALARGKLVINGAFKSVVAINSPKPLSLLFQPSNRQSLYEALHQAWEAYASLQETYKEAASIMQQCFTYDAHVADMVHLKKDVSNAMKEAENAVSNTP